MRISIVGAIVASCLVPAAAQAVPGHYDVQVKAKKNKAGVVCGATVTCVARSDNRGYGHAIVGLVPADKVKGWPSSNPGRKRARSTIGHVKVTTPLHAKVPVKLEFDYAQGVVTPGAKYHVVSGYPSGDYTHVYGAVTQTSPANEFTMPAAPTAKLSREDAAKQRAAIAAGKTQITALRQTHRTATTDLRTQHKDATAKLRATHATQTQKLKDTAAARRGKLQARLAAAPTGPKKTAVRALLAQDTKRTQADRATLKTRQTRALGVLKTRQDKALSTLSGRQSNALTRLQATLGV